MNTQIVTNARRANDPRGSHGLLSRAKAGPTIVAMPTIAQAEGLIEETRKSPKGTEETSHAMPTESGPQAALGEENMRPCKERSRC